MSLVISGAKKLNSLKVSLVVNSILIDESRGFRAKRWTVWSKISELIDESHAGPKGGQFGRKTRY